MVRVTAMNVMLTTIYQRKLGPRNWQELHTSLMNNSYFSVKNANTADTYHFERIKGIVRSVSDVEIKD
jgi:hypothetical protein